MSSFIFPSIICFRLPIHFHSPNNHALPDSVFLDTADMVLRCVQFPAFKYVVAQIDYMHEAAQSVHYTPTFRFVRGGKTVDQFYGASHQQLHDHLWLHSDDGGGS